MSRERIAMQDGSLLVIGYDRPFATWYALHFDTGDDNAPPRVALGYHPAEQALLRAERPDAVIGPYPIGDDQVEAMLSQMIPELMGIEREEKQSGCWFCGKPPWQSNPDCASHPFNRLRAS